MNLTNANFVDTPQESHTCEARKEGDWIVFTCPACPSYERRYNYKIRQMQVKNSSPAIKHTGNLQHIHPN